MMKTDKILVINSTDLLNTYLKNSFEKYSIETIICKNPLDGLIKMKNELPDLVIIDYQLTQTDKADFFQEKRDYKTVAEIPVICLSSKIDIDAVRTAGKNRVFKFFEKPLKHDQLLKTIGEALHRELEFDTTPSIIEVSLNNTTLFIEIGLGINREKIDLLQYKIKELMRFYNSSHITTLIMFNDMKIDHASIEKFYSLITTILSTTGQPAHSLKVLTTNKDIINIMKGVSPLDKIAILPDLPTALDALGTLSVDALVAPQGEFAARGELTLDNTDVQKHFIKKPLIIAIDDDELILDLIAATLASLNIDIVTYRKATAFFETFDKGVVPDLLLLDLMMPDISGFDVLDRLRQEKQTFPVIIFSAFSQKETVTRTMQYGIKRFMVKPIDPELLLIKVTELLQSDF